MPPTIRETWPLPDTALKPALALALAIEHAPMGVLMLLSEVSGALEPVVAEGMTEEQWSRFGPERPGVGPLGVAYAEHRRVTVRDILSDGNGASSLRDLARGIGFRGLDVVPLKREDGSVIGAMAALFRCARRPSARAGRLAEHCGRLMAVALDNARLRAESEHRREMVEALSRARVEYMARMGHELRTPLQSITGYMELLRLDDPDSLTPRQRQMLDRVRESEQVLIHAIDDLGTMARLEAGRLSYLTVAVVASQAIATACAVIAPLAQKKNIQVDAATDDALVAMADEMKLKQVLVNLLANAVKFTPSGGSVRIGARPEPAAIVFEVSDTGPGIPDSKLDDVFEPYVQLGTPVSGIAGSGLGLAISHEFAHGMGGSLTASSVPGQGAVFQLRLPRA